MKAVNMFGELLTDSALLFLRRIVKLLESLGNVDSSGRQRITVDAITAGTTLPAVTTVTTVSTVSSVTNIAAIAGLDQRQFADQSRIAYNTGIRSNLNFS